MRVADAKAHSIDIAGWKISVISGTNNPLPCSFNMDKRGDRNEPDAQDVRQGEIILKKPWQRWVFGIGLFGGIAWIVLMTWFFRWYS